MGEDQADKQRPTEVTFPGAETREADSAMTRKTIVDVALGGSHSCFLDSGGAVGRSGGTTTGGWGASCTASGRACPDAWCFPRPGGEASGRANPSSRGGGTRSPWREPCDCVMGQS